MASGFCQPEWIGILRPTRYHSAITKNNNIIKERCLSGAMELEPVQNCIAAAANPVEREALELLKK